MPLLYVKVTPDRLTVRNIKTGQQISEVPELAISRGVKKQVVLGFGAGARKAAVGQQSEVVNPLAHPRTLVGDFTVGEVLLKAFIHEVHRKALFSLSPRIVMHPLGSPEGGFTQIERRALREMAVGAGAAEVVLWVGRELSDQEVQSEKVLKSEGARQ